MSQPKAFRTFIVFDTEIARTIEGFLDAYVEASQEEVARLLDPELARLVESGEVELFFPSLDVPPRTVWPDTTGQVPQGPAHPPHPHGAETIADLDRLVLAFASDNPDQLAKVAGFIMVLNARPVADLPFEPADHWCPGAPPGHQFGDPEAARRLIKAQVLSDAGLVGANVHVAIVDRGLNADAITVELGGIFGGGWTYCPNAAPPCMQPGTLTVIRGVTDNEHGMDVARNLLRIAPQAIVHDVPLIPQRISNLALFLSNAYAVFYRMLIDIRARVEAGDTRPWVLVNAWGVFDRLKEIPPGSYTADPTHFFNLLIGELVAARIDVVFAAGNCGQFCPDLRCGPYDRGPGRSIFGANSHPNVISVGAVRTDRIWIGSSAQGPGALDPSKPDLVAPSAFTETGDRHTRNGGTSTACALAAGVVAALRQEWHPSTVSPDALRTALRVGARPAGLPPTPARRFGAGIIDAAGAMAALPS
jgi:hypothetical protein